MNWVDVVVVATLLWFTLDGWRTGIIRQVTTILAVILGAVLAGRLYGRLADDVHIFVGSRVASDVIAFLAIFFAIIGFGQLAAWYLRRLASVLLLGPADNILGALFGFAKGFLLVEALLLLFITFQVGGVTRTINHALLAPLFVQGFPILLHVLPHEFHRAADMFGR